MSTSRRTAASFGLVMALALAACAPQADDDAAPDGDGETIAIGLLNPLTGPFAALGEDVNDGFQLYLDEHEGQLGGYEIEVVAEDEANDTAVATEHAERMVERDEVRAIVGFVNSGVAYGASTLIEEAGVPLIVSVAGADDLTQRDAVDNIYRVSYTGSSDAMPAGTYACEELGYETASVIGLDYAFGWEGVGGFSRAFEDAGCDVVQETYVPLDTSDWAPFVQELRSDVDVVWSLNAGPDAIRFVQAYRDFRGGDVPLMAHGSTVDEEVLAQQRQAAEGVVSTLHYSRMIDTPENNEFVELFEEAQGRTVSRYAEAGWTAAMVLDAALDDIGELPGDREEDYAALTEAIGGVAIEAPRGPLSFDERGQAVQHIYVREVREVDGEYQNVVIDTIEEVSQFWTYDPEEYLAEPPYAELTGSWADN